MLGLVVALAIPITTVALVALFYLFQRSTLWGDRTWRRRDLESQEAEQQARTKGGGGGTARAQAEAEEEEEEEDLLVFQGGEHLTICDILEAPGEVIGKSNYGTLYKALLLLQDQGTPGQLRLLRFLRPVCAAASNRTTADFIGAVQFLGSIRHPNLVPLLGFYSGPRGEKLLIYPFYRRGNLAEFIRDGGGGESRRWATIHKISIGIARGLDHLHTGTGRLMKPVIHGNLKSRNILLDRNREARVSDFGLHLLLNPTAGQEMLDTLGSEGYKAPELIKMKDANGDTDVYSLGVILLELVTGKVPVNHKAGPDPDPDGELYLPNYRRKEGVVSTGRDHVYSPGIHDDEDAAAAAVAGATEEERILGMEMFRLGMACCSPSPSLRPNIKQVIKKLEEMGT